MNTYEVEAWLKDNLSLTDGQTRMLRDNEVIRFSSVRFYKEVDVKTSILWRLSVILFVPYIVLLFLFFPVKWMFTGNRYIGQKYLDKYHYPWVRKIGF
jgi:hypothetical protein